MENQHQVRLRKKDRFGFVGKNCMLFHLHRGIYIQRTLEVWRNTTNVEQPICEAHRKPARFRVVKDLLKEIYGRPYFTSADRENPCYLWMWLDENQVEKRNCHHRQLTAMKRVEKDGPKNMFTP